jgi:cell division protein FtsQ
MNPFRSSQNSRRRSRPDGVVLHAKTSGGGGGRYIFAFALFSILAVGAVVGAYWLRNQWLYRVDSLAVRRIPVEVDGVLLPAEVRDLSGVKIGQNILSIDLPSVRDRLRRHPRIEDASLTVEFPETLRIVIKERVPLARVTPLADKGIPNSYLLDISNRSMPPLEPGHAAPETIEDEASLPLITGINPRVRGPDQNDYQTLAALQLLAQFDVSDVASQVRIMNIDVSEPGFLTVKTAGGAAISVGAVETNYTRVLRQWAEVQAKAVEMGRMIGAIDLSVTNNAPLRWLELADAAQQTNLPPLRPARWNHRPRRPHV